VEEVPSSSEPYLSRRSSTIDIIADDEGVSRNSITSEVTLPRTYIMMSLCFLKGLLEFIRLRNEDHYEIAEAQVIPSVTNISCACVHVSVCCVCWQLVQLTVHRINSMSNKQLANRMNKITQCVCCTSSPQHIIHQFTPITTIIFYYIESL
jgi:hypothetical protein